MRVLLVGNPASGGGRGRNRIAAAEAGLRRAGAHVETILTEQPGHASRLLQSPPTNIDRVVACGGDGLVQEAASAMAGRELPLAIVPAGRGNDFARALGLPLEIAAAARLAISGLPRRVDLGLANGRRFCTVAACGLDAEVARRARVSRLPLPGPTIYVAQLLLALVRGLPAFDAAITIDGRRVDSRLMVLAVANTPTYGGGFRIAPSARVDDGRLEACLIRASSRPRALALFPRVFAGRHVSLPEVSMIACEEIDVETAPAMAIEADGESVAATPCAYRVERGVLAVIAGTAGGP